MTDLGSRPLNAQIWDRVDDDWYVEPEWCSRRLFEEEAFAGEIHDPCCGIGRIVKSAWYKGLIATGSDIVSRAGWPVRDFLSDLGGYRNLIIYDNIVTNPPFDIAPAIVTQALATAQRKVAVIFPTARLNAAHWITCTPLRRVWLMTPRPSMPPGRVVLSGGKVGGGKTDFCWLVFEKGYGFEPELRWLHRDK